MHYSVACGITTLTYGALCRGLLSGAMRLDRQFAIGDMRKNTDPKFQAPHFFGYVNAANELDAFARENFGTLDSSGGMLAPGPTRRWNRAVGRTSS